MFFQELEPDTWQTFLPLSEAKSLMEVSSERTMTSWCVTTQGPAKVTLGLRASVIEYDAMIMSTVPFCRNVSRLAERASLNSTLLSSTPSCLVRYLATST